MTKNIINTVSGCVMFCYTSVRHSASCRGQTHVLSLHLQVQLLEDTNIHKKLRRELEIRKNSFWWTNQVFAGKSTWELAAPCLTLILKRDFLFILLRDILGWVPRKWWHLMQCWRRSPLRGNRLGIFSETLWKWQNASPSFRIPSWEWRVWNLHGQTL